METCYFQNESFANVPRNLLYFNTFSRKINIPIKFHLNASRNSEEKVKYKVKYIHCVKDAKMQFFLTSIFPYKKEISNSGICMEKYGLNKTRILAYITQ